MDVRDGKREIPSMMGLLDNMSDKDLSLIAEFYEGKKRQFGLRGIRFSRTGQIDL